MLLQAAIGRDDIANYVSALFEVYIILILLYVLINLMLGFGARPPYSRAFDALMSFLRDISEPCLRLFRRLLPSFGGIDLSPMVAIFTLGILDKIIYSLITG
jgi:YggT family protein